MAAVHVAAPTAPPLDRSAALATGLLYLVLGVAGVAGFIVLRPVLVADDAATTLANLVEHESLARSRVAVELALVVAQTLVALAFFRLFRAVDDLAAAAIAVFGLLNSVALMASAAAMAAALEVALDGGEAGTVQALEGLSLASWTVGNLFFGLWLVPMGLCALRSGAMPRALGWVLVVGGGGYVLSGFGAVLWPDLAAAEVLVVPATVGELWMIGWLLAFTWRTRRA